MAATIAWAVAPVAAQHSALERRQGVAALHGLLALTLDVRSLASARFCLCTADVHRFRNDDSCARVSAVLLSTSGARLQCCRLLQASASGVRPLRLGSMTRAAHGGGAVSRVTAALEAAFARALLLSPRAKFSTYLLWHGLTLGGEAAAARFVVGLTDRVCDPVRVSGLLYHFLRRLLLGTHACLHLRCLCAMLQAAACKHQQLQFTQSSRHAEPRDAHTRRLSSLPRLLPRAQRASSHCHRAQRAAPTGHFCWPLRRCPRACGHAGRQRTSAQVLGAW